MKDIKELIKNERILIVDDRQVNIDLLQMILKKEGFANVVATDNPESVIDLCRSFEPRVVLLDLSMPRLDGFGVMEQMQEVYPDFLPVIVLTAMRDQESKIRALKAGARDFVTKPFDREEVMLRISNLLEINLLHDELKQQAVMLDDNANERLEELDRARHLQETLIPSNEELGELGDEKGLLIQAFFEPSEELAGDIWDIGDMGEGQIFFYMADFAGHGVTSAMNTFRLHSFVSEAGLNWEYPHVCLGEINRFLKKVLPVGQYATLMVGYVDLGQGKVFYSGAGAPPAILGHVNDLEAISYFECKGVPAGIVDGPEYDLRTLDLPEGSFLFLYSDAMVEVDRGGGKALEYDALLNLVKECVQKNGPENLMDSVLERFFEENARPLSDDLTAVSFYRPPNGSKPA